MRVLVLLTLMLFMICTTAFGDVCQTTAVNQLLGTTCTIAGTSFEFTSYQSVHLNLSTSEWLTGMLPDAVLFTPDPSDPLSPAFTLSSAQFTSTNPWADDFFLYFNVSPVPGYLFTNVTATISATTSVDGSGWAFAFAQNQLWGAMYHRVSQSNLNGFVQPGEEISNLGLVGPVDGRVWVETAGTGNGNSTLQSARFVYNETPIPEPATILLGVSGLAPIVKKAMRKRRSRV